MCCSKNETGVKELTRKHRRRGWFTAWKRLQGDGSAVIASDYRYAPGWNIARTSRGRAWLGRYNWQEPRGCHVFLRKPPPEVSHKCAIIPVVCRLADLVIVGYGQAVLRRVRITKPAWRKAFPNAG